MMINRCLCHSMWHVSTVAIFCMASAHTAVCADAMLPKVWMSTTPRNDMEETIRMCAEQGVDCVEVPTWQVEDCRRSLAALRKYGVKGFTSTGSEPSMDSRPASRDGKPCERAVCVAGAYRGLAIDRNLFSFTAGPHEIIVEPPVYSVRQPYTRRTKNPDGTESVIRSGHYFGGFRPTGEAEVIVPERLFDGTQHLRIIPCKVLPAGPDDKPKNDTATGMSGPEIENRRLVRLKFDLTDCEGLMLDKVGIAVYWESDPDSTSWKNGSGQLSVFSALTRERARYVGTWRANQWVLANDGTFPSNDIVAIRFGDECFNLTGWVDCPAASFPLWGFSPSGRAAFAEAAKALGTATNSSFVTRHSSLVRGAAFVAPRTFGFPEIYGAEAYGVALYEFHKACAGLVRAFREGVHEVSPDLLVFRNTTRAGVWSDANDHDGSGQELLARELDFIHLDPYPIHGGSYATETIPCDMGYMSGFARRFGKPLIPWMQAHAYAPSGLGDITPADMKRMWEQHLPFGPAGMMWLGFNAHPGNSDTEMTFPKRSPESWAYAKQLFAEVHNAKSRMENGEWRMENGATNSSLFTHPSSPAASGGDSSLVTRHSSLTMASGAIAPLAIVRPYSTRASRCWTGNGWRNPADSILEAYARAWGIDNGLLFDVFELPPEAEASMHNDGENSSLVTRHSSLPSALAAELSRYPLVVSTIPLPGLPNVRVIGEGTEGTSMTVEEIGAMRRAFASEIAEMGHNTQR